MGTKGPQRGPLAFPFSYVFPFMPPASNGSEPAYHLAPLAGHPLQPPTGNLQIDPQADGKQLAEQFKQHPNPAKLFLAYLKKLTTRWDAVILVTGPEGTGKSTAAEHIARSVDPTFSIERVNTSAEDYLKDLSQADPGQAILFDESAEGLHNRNSMRKASKFLNEVLMEARVFNLVQLLCFPRFGSVDLYTRTFRARVWVRCLKPGLAEVRFRDWAKPVGDNAAEAKQAYPMGWKMSFPQIDDEYWGKREGRKKRFVKDKINQFLEE